MDYCCVFLPIQLQSTPFTENLTKQLDKIRKSKGKKKPHCTHCYSRV